MVEQQTPVIETQEIFDCDELFVPESALAYQPSHAETFMTASTGQTQRMIFTSVTLTEAEQKHWDAFLEFCSVNNLDVPQ